MSALTWAEPVTDRTKEDVDKVISYNRIGWKSLSDEQKKEWSDGLKGALNLKDINRIKNNVQIVADMLGVDIQQDTMSEFVTESFFNALRAEIISIREKAPVHFDTPAVPTTPLNDYQKINDIEKILYDIHDILSDNPHYYAGTEIYAGESLCELL